MTMSITIRRTGRGLTALVLAGSVAAAGCNDFLTGGDLEKDPTAPLTATNKYFPSGLARIPRGLFPTETVSTICDFASIKLIVPAFSLLTQT